MEEEKHYQASTEAMTTGEKLKLGCAAGPLVVLIGWTLYTLVTDPAAFLQIQETQDPQPKQKSVQRRETSARPQFPEKPEELLLDEKTVRKILLERGFNIKMFPKAKGRLDDEDEDVYNARFLLHSSEANRIFSESGAEAAMRRQLMQISDAAPWNSFWALDEKAKSDFVIQIHWILREQRQESDESMQMFLIWKNADKNDGDHIWVSVDLMTGLLEIDTQGPGRRFVETHRISPTFQQKGAIFEMIKTCPIASDPESQVKIWKSK